MFFRGNIACALLFAASYSYGQDLDLTHGPGVGFFGTGVVGDSFLDVDPTEQGAIVTVFLKSGGPKPEVYRASWNANTWTKLAINELTTTGDGEKVVDELFNPFGDIGGLGLSEGFDFMLPPNPPLFRHSFLLDAEPSRVFCRDENGEFGHTCTGTYTIRYSVTAFPTPLGGDFNYDDAVDFADFTILSSNFSLHKPGFSWKDGDATLDGVVDFADFLILSHNFGATRDPQLAAVPEPASLALLMSACLGIGLFRRWR